MPGITAPPTQPPNALMSLLMKRPEQVNSLVKQAVLLLEQVAQLDPRQEPRMRAALRIIRGPSKVEPNP